MNSYKNTFAVLAVAGILAAMSVATGAYTLNSAKWGSGSALVSINPQNNDWDATLTENALRWALNEWNTNSGSNFQWIYNGRSNQTSTGNDGKNLMVFRNTDGGGAIATTYTWWSGGSLVDSDVIFWDGSYTFLSGTSGCSGGIYIEDVAVHELGHALGLGHSSATDASMFPSYSYCSQDMRSLAADDKAGAQALYGRGGSSNTAPSVAISSPSTGSSTTPGALVAFSGSAADTQDGDLSNNLSWSSSLEGWLGTGASFSKQLTIVGNHTVTASVTDSGGATTTRQVTVAVANPVAPGSATLSARGYKVKGSKRTDLSWTGFSDSSVAVYRNGSLVTATANDGAFTDSIGGKGAGTYQYKACGTSSGACSNIVSVSF